MPSRAVLTSIGVALLGGLWLSMMLLGAGPVDRFLLGELYAAHRPALRDAAMIVTLFGNWQAVILLSLIAAVWLIYRKKVRSALLLLSVTLLGRGLVEMQKFGIARLRPDELEHLVPVKSLSFPSAHAANSMVLLLSLATIAAPRDQRWWTVPAALAGTFLVGISRPLLGVHWPSDVVGGWAFGAAWVLVMLALAERWTARESRR
jgi:membrane-associated phospholipid phosphatase